MRSQNPDTDTDVDKSTGNLAKIFRAAFSIDDKIYRKVEDRFGNPTNRLSLEGQDPNQINHYDLNEYAQMTSGEVKEHFLFQSCLVIHHNWEINKKRDWWFRQSYRFTFLGILLVLVALGYGSILSL
jgi:hypothetical protein